MTAHPKAKRARSGNGKETASWPRKARAGAVAAVAAVAAAVPAAADSCCGTAESRRLCETVSAESAGVCFLGFSRGKDSIAAWLYLRRFFKRIIPFHCASVPHMDFVDLSLAYCERWFDTPILRLMDGACLGAVNRLIWQPPDAESDIDAREFWEFDKHDILDALRAEMGLPGCWCAFGINASDSIDRRIYVNKYQGRNDERRTFYPTWDWSKSQVVAAVRAAGVALPADYQMAARSMASVPSYRHLLRMESMQPAAFREVELMFPLIRAELARQAFREAKTRSTPTTTVSPCTGSERAAVAGCEVPNTGGQK